jgi:predicted RecA/RadA family phage recombinase
MAEAVFVQEGASLDYTPTSAVLAGTVVVQSGLVGITKLDIAANILGALCVEGVFDVAKAVSTGVTFAYGDKVFWDNTAKVAVATSAGGANKLMGTCVKAAANADATVRTKLQGSAGEEGGTDVSGVATGYKIARGETALDGSNPTPVATGLTTVIAFTATLKGTAAPGVGTQHFSANIAGAAGNVDVYAWKPTSNADPTLIASAGTESFYWIAVGT